MICRYNVHAFCLQGLRTSSAGLIFKGSADLGSSSNNNVKRDE